MSFDYRELRGLIRARVDSETAAAERIGISKAKLSARLNNRQSFKQEEIAALKEVLDIPNERVWDYFFKEKVR